jgi:polyisoprenoid-binding protein YceI
VLPQSRLWVSGTSTVRSWTCKANTFDTALEAAPDAVAAVLGGQKAIRTVVVSVPAAQLGCGNGTMDEHMLKALKAKENPTIEFRLASYEVARAATGIAGTLHGTLTLGGQQQPIAIAAQGVEVDGALRVTGSTTLNMKEFGLKPPTLMMGTLKVGEQVTVAFDLLLKS